MTKRPGLTLTEVLVAIFISGIGLISLLVLFPLGALNMNQAIKDQRAADASRIAAAQAKYMPTSTVNSSGTTVIAYGLKDDPNVYPLYTNSQGGIAPQSGQPSFPVFVDPAGYQVFGAGNVGGQSPGIPRTIPQYLQNPGATPYSQSFTTSQLIQRWTKLQDELTFSPDGQTQLAGTLLERTPRYSWAWMLQQSKAQANPPGPPTSSGVYLTVIVYDRRPLVSQALEEVQCQAAFHSGTNMASLTWSSMPPPLKRGGWILDSTMQPSIHGYFYRIVNVTPTGANSADIELHTQVVNGTSLSNGVGIVMDGVVEVFFKGQL